MSSLRTPKNLPEWLELDYHRRPRALKSLWKPLVLATLFGAAVVMLVLAVVQKQGSPRLASIYQAGPLSPAHALFNNDCGVCHVEGFRTGDRLLRLDSAIRSVSDETCQQCHAGPVHNAKQAHNTGCVSCHREHHGPAMLKQVADAGCTGCHAHLAAAVKRGGQPAFRDVARWADHPAFARRWEGAPADPGTVTFNHAVHLDPDGVSVLHDPDTPPPADRRGQRKVLHCADCHQPDKAGRTMQPIRYASHCGDCHPLTVSVPIQAETEAAGLALKHFRQTPAPHQEPEIVRAVLRDRLTQLIQKTPDLLGVPSPSAKPARPIPGTPPTRPETVSREEFDWVGKQLIEVEKPLFWSKSQAGCAYCHQRAGPEQSPGALPQFAASQINERKFADVGVRAEWFPHSRFKHDSHRMLNCAECHPAPTSRLTSDVLLPEIDTCRRCHNAAAASARTDCIACHGYHPSAGKREFHGKLTIDQALGK